MKNIKDTMLLKKVCEFYWYDLSIKNNKVTIINQSNKEFNCKFDNISSALKYFIDDMKQSNKDSEDGFIWDNKYIKYIENLNV